jgi:hypothetical protein
MQLNNIVSKFSLLLLQFDKFQLKNIRSKLIQFYSMPIKIIINIYNVNTFITISYKNRVFYTKSTGVLGFINRERRFSFAINMLLKDSVSYLIFLCRKFKCGKIEIYFKKYVFDYSILHANIFNIFSFYLVKWFHYKIYYQNIFKYKLLFLLFILQLNNKRSKYFINNKIYNLKNKKMRSYLFMKLKKIKKFPITINKIVMYNNTSFGEGIKRKYRQDLQYW